MALPPNPEPHYPGLDTTARPEPDFLKQVALSEALKLRAGINDAAQVITAARLFEGYLKETADVDL